MRRRLVLVALLLAGCATPKLRPPLPAPTPEPKAISPAPVAPTKGSALSDLRANLAKADDLLVAGQNREAVALLLQAVGAQPENPAAWDLLTLGLIRLGEADAATMTGERAIRLQPEGATVRFNTGLAYYRKENWPEAIRHLTAAARLNQASTDPKLFLARAQAWEALARRDAPAIRAAVAHFPDDPELQRIPVLLSLANNDLDLDGKPEILNAKKNPLTLTSGANGTVYLSISRPAGSAENPYGLFGLLGDEGERFFLLNYAPRHYALYRFDGRALVEVGSGPGEASFDRVKRELSTGALYPDQQVVTSERYTWKGGALRQVATKSTPTKNPEPQPPLKDSVDLFLAGRRLEQSAFASESLYTETMKRVLGLPAPEKFLLPAPDGSFRLELWSGAERLASARVTVDKEWRIETVTWE